MPRKQATINESSAAAAPARATKPRSPRVQSAKHTKSAPVTENPAIETQSASALDSAAVANILQAELPVEQIETSMFVSASAPVNGDPREEIARLAYGYWQARGCVGGDPLEDWVRAENEYHQQLG